MDDVAEERRIFDRFSARFPAKFKDSRNDYGTEVFLRDASAGGARLITKDRSYINDSLSLLVELPDGQGPLNLNGYVVWAKPQDVMWEIGITFHRIELLKLHRLFKFALPEAES
jgi:hypothetical protein